MLKEYPKANHADWRPWKTEELEIVVTHVGSKAIARSPQVPDLTSYGNDENEARANVQDALDALGRAKRRLMSVARLVEDEFARRYARERTQAFVSKFAHEAVIR